MIWLVFLLTLFIITALLCIQVNGYNSVKGLKAYNIPYIDEGMRKVQRSKFSWKEAHCEVTEDGDMKWKPKLFVFEGDSSVRYIDYENRDDNNDGVTKSTPWKHHPWDEKAERKAKGCKGVHTHIFKRGVIQRQACMQGVRDREEADKIDS